MVELREGAKTSAQRSWGDWIAQGRGECRVDEDTKAQSSDDEDVCHAVSSESCFSAACDSTFDEDFEAEATE